MANPIRPDGVSALLNLGRSYALVEVLRQINDNVPDDLLYMYLYETDTSGLTRCVLNTLKPSEKESSTYNYGNVEYVTRRDAVIPKALRNMAKEYMTRCFWDHVYFLLQASQHNAGTLGERDRLYPANVRDALHNMFLPTNNVPLNEIALQTNSLHGAIAPNVSSKALRQYNVEQMRLAHYDVLSLNDARKLDRLLGVAYSFCAECGNRNALPTGSDLQTLCNILDIFLLLTPQAPISFAESYNFKQIFEYSKMSSTISEKPRYFGDCCCCGQGYSYGRRNFEPGFKDTVLSTYEHLSPHSAICIGKLVRNVQFLDGEQVDVNRMDYANYSLPFRTLLKKVNPRPSIAIKLFVEKELEVMRVKAQMRSSDTLRGGLYNGARCCDAEDGCCCS